MTERDAFVFKPMKYRLTVLGLGGKEWAVTVAVAAVCALAAWGLGFWTHDAPAQVPQAEQSAQASSLREQRSAMQRLETREKASGSREAALDGASESDKRLSEQAQASGVTGATTDSELSALVERERIEPAPVIPDVPRWMAVFFAPTLLAAALQAELFHNSSITKELGRLVRNWAGQHVYASDPERFMEACERGDAR